MKNNITQILKDYAKELGPYFPLNCKNLLVASQYALPLTILKKYLQPKDVVLDWGCGGGHFSYLLMQEDYEVSSYAFCPAEELKIIRTKVKNTWKCIQAVGNDPITLPYQEGMFDGILSLGVLEHVKETGGDEISSLQECYRLLKPGGYFFCFHFPNRYSWIEALSRLLNKVNIPKYSHAYRYSESDIYALIHTSSFSLLEMGRYNLFPRRMLRLVPNALAERQEAFYTYQALEKLCTRVFGSFSQNYYFVLKK